MKPRSDSPLKNLSEERQEQIIEWCNTPKSDACVGGHKFAKQQLAADGIKVSEGALSDFYSWWNLRRDFRRTDSLTSDFEELLRKEFPTADPKRIQDFGQTFFTMQAMAQRDSEEFRQMEYLRVAQNAQLTKQLDLELKTKVFQVKTCELFLEWFEDKRAKEIATSGATHSEKIEALGQAMFGEDWKD